MPNKALSKKELEALQRRFRDLNSDQHDAMQRLIVPMPMADLVENDPRLIQYAQCFFPGTFICLCADQIGGRDCTSEVADYDRDRFLLRVLREPTLAPPQHFGRLVHHRLCYYSALVLPGGLSVDMLKIAREQEAAWQARGGANPRLFVELLSPWSEPSLELHARAMRLGPEFVLERALRAVELGIRGVLCAPGDVEHLRPRLRAFPAEDPVRILVDGAFDPARSPPVGYTRTGSYEEAMRFGADAVMLEADIWSLPDPMERIFAILAQMAAGRAVYDATCKSC